ncbi:MAG: divergent polysaccharide deacetylase family protein [Pararhodobacter sp.]
MSGFAGGFLKGIVTGVAAFVLGFAALSVIFPPAPREVPRQQAAEPVQPADPVAQAVPETSSPQGGMLPPLAPPSETRLVVPGQGGVPVPGSVATAPVADHTAGAEEAPDGDLIQPTLPDTGQAMTPDGPADDGNGAAPEIMVPAEQAAEPAPEGAPAPVVPPAPAEPASEPGPVADSDRPTATAAPEPPMLRAPGSLFQPEPDGASGTLPQIGQPPAPLPPTASTPAASMAEGADPGGTTVAPDDAVAAPDPVPEAQAGRDVPVTRPGSEQPRQVEGVVIGRLPSIVSPVDPETGDDAMAEGPSEDAVAPQADDPALPAHIRFAAPHDAPEGLPRLSVVLVDAPPDPEAETALLELDMPLGVALDPADDDAPRRAQAYRAAGHEVLILGQDLPARATPADIEVTLSAWSAQLPQAIGLLDPSSSGLQGNVVLARLVMPALAERGLGVVLPGGGLGGAQQAARAEGVVNAVIFRDLDQGSENRFTIRRYIDRAVFEAQRQGGVVLVGRANHSETIAALALWRSEGRADAVGLVPISALLQLD